MIAMTVPPGRRDQRRELVDQLQRCERQRRGAVTLGFGQPIDDAFGVEQFKTLEREAWTGTVAQQPLQAGAVIRSDTDRGIQREAAVLPSKHVAHVVTLDQPAAGKPAQHSDAHLFGDGGEGLRCELDGGARAHGLRAVIGLLDRLEDAVDDAAMVMHMAVERSTEAMDEAHRPEACMRTRAAALDQMPLDDAQQDAQDGAEGLWLALRSRAATGSWCTMT